MRVIVSGHRKHKLETYSADWIKQEIKHILRLNDVAASPLLAYSGMAGGVDLWFCQSCLELGIPYIACVPFDEQAETLAAEDRSIRAELLEKAKEIKKVKNSWMVEHCDIAIAVWDGNKGGTHNVVQQLVEKKKHFYWVNPVSKITWLCFQY